LNPDFWFNQGMQAIIKFLLTLIITVFTVNGAWASIPEDGHSAVILAYHRIGEDANPDSNISANQFLAHVEEIEKGGYNVISLPELVEGLKKNLEFPARTIAITFEGGFKSALKNAIPALLVKKIPFTVFYSSDYADADSADHVSWSDLKTLSGYSHASFGVLPAAYARHEGEEEIKRQINKARQRHREMLGAEAAFFSYPFGEYSPAYKDIVRNAGFSAAFGLQSGAVYDGSDFFALPRFTMTERYGDVERFRTAAQTLPFPVYDIEPQGTRLNDETPSIGFSVPDYLVPGLKSLSCFVTGQPEPEVEILGERVEIRVKDAVNVERLRVNCTLPGPANPEDDTPAWRWFGMLLVNETVEEPTQPPTGLP
jgi:poly-beta-1,6-N-acetyl-D-glucosamine N-deacetylase